MSLGEWEVKPAWGRTRCTHDSPLYSRHELEVEAGGTCSVHYHRHRGNRFFVVSGSIAVVEYFAWEAERTILTAGNTLDVPALVVHQFQVIQSGACVEEYWPDRGPVRNDDIVRLCEGRRWKVEELADAPAELLMRAVALL